MRDAYWSVLLSLLVVGAIYGLAFLLGIIDDIP
jgi:hypothetical protein